MSVRGGAPGVHGLAIKGVLVGAYAQNVTLSEGGLTTVAIRLPIATAKGNKHLQGLQVDAF